MGAILNMYVSTRNSYQYQLEARIYQFQTNGRDPQPVYQNRE